MLFAFQQKLRQKIPTDPAECAEPTEAQSLSINPCRTAILTRHLWGGRIQSLRAFRRARVIGSMGSSVDGSMGSWVVGLVCPWVGRSATPGGVLGTFPARFRHVQRTSRERLGHVRTENAAILQPNALRNRKTMFSFCFGCVFQPKRCHSVARSSPN